jgi:hypothetical protein
MSEDTPYKVIVSVAGTDIAARIGHDSYPIADVKIKEWSEAGTV